MSQLPNGSIKEGRLCIMYKITFKEWLNSSDKLFIHCKTQAEADFLCKELIKAGKTWCTGSSYLNTNYVVHEEQTCYSNKGTIRSTGSFPTPYLDSALFQFESVDFKQPLKEPLIINWFD